MAMTSVVDRTGYFLLLSTDTRPSIGLTMGDWLYETDIGNTYTWNGAAWAVYSDPGPRRVLNSVDGANYQVAKLAPGAAVANHWSGTTMIDACMAAWLVLANLVRFQLTWVGLTGSADNHGTDRTGRSVKPGETPRERL